MERDHDRSVAPRAAVRQGSGTPDRTLARNAPVFFRDPAYLDSVLEFAVSTGQIQRESHPLCRPLFPPWSSSLVKDENGRNERANQLDSTGRGKNPVARDWIVGPTGGEA